MKSILNTLIILSIITAIACDSPFELDAEQAPVLLVIEGLVTNEDTTHYVRITRTKDFGTSDDNPVVSTATVEISDNQGNTYNYVYNPTENQKWEGYYFSENNFAGKIGNIYTMSVTHEGKEYTGSDILLRVTGIDSLTVKVEEDLKDLEEPIPGIGLDEFYEVFFYATEPQETKDYYLFKYYKNGEILKDSDSDIYFAEDTFVGENIDDIATAGYYAEGDVATVEFYSLSREGFVYYTDMFNVLNNDGGMFGAVPANPRTNIKGGALGYFQTSAVNRKSIVIKDPG